MNKFANADYSKTKTEDYINSIYELAKCDIMSGKLKRVKELLKEHEAREDFECCAGIVKALNEFNIEL